MPGGREAAARPLDAQALRGCADDGDALTMRVAHGALTVLELGLGNYQSALRHELAAFGGRAGSEQGFRGET